MEGWWYGGVGNSRQNIVLTGKTYVITLTAVIVLEQNNVIEVIFLVSGSGRMVVFRSDHMFIFGFGNVDYMK